MSESAHRAEAPPTPADARPRDAAVRELQRQVERGSLFTHTALGESFVRLGEMQALLHGLTDALLARGVVGEPELGASIANVRAELGARGELSGAGVVMRVDATAETSAGSVAVDCQARLPVCQAVCCRLDFALSVAEVEAGRVRWDLGRPYFVRHTAAGRCVHHDAATGGCGVYADRPQVCRQYSCAGDERIWKDYERAELNAEWIAANLPPQAGPRAVAIFMAPSPPAPGEPAYG
jgi:Fe-S-cluster containining protein